MHNLKNSNKKIQVNRFTPRRSIISLHNNIQMPRMSTSDINFSTNIINLTNTNFEDSYPTNNKEYNQINKQRDKYSYFVDSIKKEIGNIKKQYFLGLITRCKDEYFIQEFCNYYFNEGVDKIYIFDDNSKNLEIYNNIKNNPNIFIYYAKNNDKCHDSICESTCTCNRVLANQIYKNVKNNFEWMIYVDVDEFVSTKKNIKKTIRQELQTTYKYVDCISIPWIIMSATSKENPESVLEKNVYRINYNNKPYYRNNPANRDDKFSAQSSGRTVGCKSIFKCNKFNGIHDNLNRCDHTPRFPNSTNIIWLESVKNTKIKLYYKWYHRELTEDCINNAYFVCYHYRVISEEHAKTKLSQNSWYIENGYNLNDLMRTSKDMLDITLKTKSIENKNNPIKNSKNFLTIQNENNLNISKDYLNIAIKNQSIYDISIDYKSLYKQSKDIKQFDNNLICQPIS